MVQWPWQRDTEPEADGPPGGVDAEPLFFCEFHDATVYIFDDHVFLERAGPSKFADKAIPRDEIVDVTYSKGLSIGYLQLEQRGHENASGGFLSSPVGENTVHFGRRDRDCAERVRDELVFDGP